MTGKEDPSALQSGTVGKCFPGTARLGGGRSLKLERKRFLGWADALWDPHLDSWGSPLEKTCFSTLSPSDFCPMSSSALPSFQVQTTMEQNSGEWMGSKSFNSRPARGEESHQEYLGHRSHQE